MIENLKEKILEEACNQIVNNGFRSMTIQSIAKACGVAVGTVYNYYSSKDEILEAYYFLEWNKCVDAIYIVSKYSKTCDAVIHCIYDQVSMFENDHGFLYNDEAANRVLGSVKYRLQGLICRQISVPLRKFCKNDIEAEIVAEALLIWIRTGKTYEDIYRNIVKLLDNS